MLPLKVELPPYTAVMLLEPGGKVAGAYLAVPALRALVARTVVPFWKVTVPVGVPLPDCGETVAVNVTGLPWSEGFTDEVSVVSVPGGVPMSPKICNCWLLATKTRPLATVGTRFALPVVFGQLPAGEVNKVFMVPPPESGSKA